jgi:hypothetical protein
MKENTHMIISMHYKHVFRKNIIVHHEQHQTKSKPVNVYKKIAYTMIKFDQKGG